MTDQTARSWEATDASLAAVDPRVAELIVQEARRQATKLQLIPSENYASRAVMQACGSVLTNKYSEGYPGRRYYEGQQVVDQVELLAIQRAKELFGVEHANVQPYSGSPANGRPAMAIIPAWGEGRLSQGRSRASGRRGRR
jgi:glycine hydroxymethyltransferase